MTNKIVDGIDVSECSYVYTDCYGDVCCDMSICDYSPCKPSEMLCSFHVDHLKTKLKEKEQECEELKEKLDNIQDSCPAFDDCSYRQCDKDRIAELEKEYEKLKSENFTFEELVKTQEEQLDDFIIDNKSLYQYDGEQPNSLAELQECMQSSMDDFQKYKQALDEIENVIEHPLVYLDEEIYNAISDIINKAREE